MFSEWNFDSLERYRPEALFSSSLLVLVIFVQLLASAGASQVVKTVQATGLAVISGSDLPAAFQRAKRAALREAVEQALGTLISSKSRVLNFSVIEDEILTRTEGFVHEFQILNQGAINPSTYQVEVEAVVGLGELQKHIGALDFVIESVGNPRVMILGRERLLSDGTWTSSSRGRIASRLIAALHETSDKFNMVVAHSEEFVRRLETIDLAMVANHAAAEGADLIIIGSADISVPGTINIPFGNDTLGDIGLRTAVVNLHIAVVWTDSREVVTEMEVVRREAALSLAAAIDKACMRGIAEMADSLIQEILQNWREKVFSSRLLRVEVIGDRRNLTIFERDFVLRVGAVEKIYRRHYAEDGAVYDIRSRQPAFDVARELSAKGLNSIGVDIRGVSLNALKIRLFD